MDTVSVARNRILQLCEERKITINKLATLSALPPSSIKNILYGKSRNPKLLTIKMICDGLDTGGDYADAVARFSSEARLIRFLRKFPADDSFRSLSACLQTNDTAGAIFALHSLNGVSALLGFCRLSDTCALLSRALKFGSPDAAAELFARLQEEYHIIVSSVSGMQDKEYI